MTGGRTSPGIWGLPAMLLFLATGAASVAVVAYLGRGQLAGGQHIYTGLLVFRYAVLLPVFWYFLRSAKPAKTSLPAIPLKWIAGPFLLMAAITSWYVTQGVIVPDESAYRFQGLVFASGRLWADAPPGAGVKISEIPPPLYFEHLLLVGPKWYSQIPPMWPAVLAPALKVGAEWLMSPLFGALLLLIAAMTARSLFGDAATGAIAALLLALSPYYLTNSVGIMTHAFCGTLVAGAVWLCVTGIRSHRWRPFLGMFALLSIACLTRYFTGAVMALALGLTALWGVRRDRGLLVRTLLTGAFFAALVLAAMLFYNHTYTGNSLVSPYALVLDSHEPFYKSPQLILNPRAIWSAILHDKRWGAQRTLFYTTPFLLLLATYGVWRERQFKTEVRILAILAVVLVVAYQIETEDSAAVNGERYYFEVFSAVAILAARGLANLAENFRFSRERVAVALGMMVCLQLCLQGTAIRGLLSKTEGERQLREAARHVSGPPRTAFLSEKLPFIPKHYLLDGPDWRKDTLMFLVDPGPAGRQEWACRMGRPEWVVFGYDPSTKSITQEFGAASRGCPAL